MKELISRVTEVTFTLSSVNRATIVAKGEVPTSGWTEAELVNPRVGDGILHLDFVALPPRDGAADVISKVEAHFERFLAGEPQDVTIHSTTNEESVRLPAQGDPP